MQGGCAIVTGGPVSIGGPSGKAEVRAYSLMPNRKGVKIRQVAPGEEGDVTINGAPFRSAGDEGQSKGLTMGGVCSLSRGTACRRLARGGRDRSRGCL